MDIFQARSASPMLLSEQKEPFDSPDYVYELKLDGIRCLAYVDANGTDLRNKRNMALGQVYPELLGIYQSVSSPGILDGELVVMADGKPDFEKLQRRALMTDPFKIRLEAESNPVTFVAFDLLYHKGQELYSVPLQERQQRLKDAAKESRQLALSRVTAGQGIALYNLAEGMDLEGIVAKRADSLYYPGKRSKDWIKIKYMQEEDFIAAGYILKEGSFVSLVLGRPEGQQLRYEGHVTLGVSRDQVKGMKTNPHCPFGTIPEGNEAATWFDYMPLCTVKYMRRTSKGGMRQPVFKGFRMDTLA